MSWTDGIAPMAAQMRQDDAHRRDEAAGRERWEARGRENLRVLLRQAAAYVRGHAVEPVGPIMVRRTDGRWEPAANVHWHLDYYPSYEIGLLSDTGVLYEPSGKRVRDLQFVGPRPSTESVITLGRVKDLGNAIGGMSGGHLALNGAAEPTIEDCDGRHQPLERALQLVLAHLTASTAQGDG